MSTQLTLFAPAPAMTTAMYTLSSLKQLIGTDAEWQTRTLSEVLLLWDKLYEDFIAEADIRIADVIKLHQHTTDAKNRRVYKTKLENLKEERMVSYGTMYSLYVDRMRVIVEEVKQSIRAVPGCEDILDSVDEFVSNVFTRPTPQDLPQTLAHLTTSLVAELIQSIA